VDEVKAGVVTSEDDVMSGSEDLWSPPSGDGTAL